MIMSNESYKALKDETVVEKLTKRYKKLSKDTRN